ncbi:MAG: Gfo/Idh/MocA family oxidoreductase [Pseudomonadota bacterium]
MREIGIGLVGAGYMGKAHAVALHAVGAVFNTALRPRCEMIATRSEDGARAAAARLGFARSTGDWRTLVADPKVEAVVIASMQDSHRAISEAAFALGKPVFCEKPLAENTASAAAGAQAARDSGVVNMIGFNYVRTPATQFVRQMLADGVIGSLHYLRIEHTEDFLADATLPANWRTEGMANGNLGDLAPHAFNCALALGGDIVSLVADMQTVVTERGGVAVTNDDQAQCLCRFSSGAMGHILSSRVAHGRKMGYAYELHGSTGSIRFDGEDQNAVWLCRGDAPAAEAGFTKILTGPAHPDYLGFCQGPGHGTGYQDQIIIEQHDFLKAIEAGESLWPDFAHGLAVHRVGDAFIASSESRQWVDVTRGDANT